MSRLDFIILLSIFSSFASASNWSVNPITSIVAPRVSASSNYLGIVSIDSPRLTNRLPLKIEIFSTNGTLRNECRIPARVLNKFGLVVFLQMTMLSDDRVALTWIDNNPMMRYAPAYLSFWLLDTRSCEHVNTQIEIRADDGLVLNDDRYFSVVTYGDKFDLFFPNEAMCHGGGCRLTMNNDGQMIGDLVSLSLYDFPALWSAMSVSSRTPRKGHILYKKNYRQFETLLVDVHGKAVKFKSFNTTTSSSNNNKFATAESDGVLGFCFLETMRRLNCTLVDANLNVIMNRLVKFDFDVLYVKINVKVDAFLILTVSKNEVYTIWKTVVLANGYTGETTLLTNLHDCEFNKIDLFSMPSWRCMLVTCAKSRHDSSILKDYDLRTTCF